MMIFNKKVGNPVQRLLLGMLVLFGLSGCEEHSSYLYLLSHPMALKQEVNRCEAMSSTPTREQAARCAMVMKAAERVQATVTEAQGDPEAFGQKVLDAEVAFVNTKIALAAAKQAVSALKNKPDSAAGLKTAEDNLAVVTKNYQDQREQIQLFFGVLGLGTPD